MGSSVCAVPQRPPDECLATSISGALQTYTGPSHVWRTHTHLRGRPYDWTQSVVAIALGWVMIVGEGGHMES